MPRLKRFFVGGKHPAVKYMEERLAGKERRSFDNWLSEHLEQVKGLRSITLDKRKNYTEVEFSELAGKKRGHKANLRKFLKKRRAISEADVGEMTNSELELALNFVPAKWASDFLGIREKAFMKMCRGGYVTSEVIGPRILVHRGEVKNVARRYFRLIPVRFARAFIKENVDIRRSRTTFEREMGPKIESMRLGLPGDVLKGVDVEACLDYMTSTKKRAIKAQRGFTVKALVGITGKSRRTVMRVLMSMGVKPTALINPNTRGRQDGYCVQFSDLPAVLNKLGTGNYGVIPRSIKDSEGGNKRISRSLGQGRGLEYARVVLGQKGHSYLGGEPPDKEQLRELNGHRFNPIEFEVAYRFIVKELGMPVSEMRLKRRMGGDLFDCQDLSRGTVEKWTTHAICADDLVKVIIALKNEDKSREESILWAGFKERNRIITDDVKARRFLDESGVRKVDGAYRIPLGDTDKILMGLREKGIIGGGTGVYGTRTTKNVSELKKPEIIPVPVWKRVTEFIGTLSRDQLDEIASRGSKMKSKEYRQWLLARHENVPQEDIDAITDIVFMMHVPGRPRKKTAGKRLVAAGK